ncbi:pyridine nucleotide-disulfide oxidoreductase/dicluster-binding protein [Desulfofustis limnaeus]|jgi:Fe-S oxidoreductase|uniref:Uncharacterized protein n=1 Tax=Desulfofustis limnaeus TaxID=2740163 RepID=A0ABN6M049_9BACT|nr:pyridine nucleotide-disulfide oxidoreductase/dicluster-binding protein [Desulfofustis limnaeus]MDX9895788.1 heterodisulfide reductase-related iron-sulfur binding cluster [Desulfofustis sp.]BDD86268.1 hypothetical protein DPPLL_06330 [Desulfofustis limnaeus]
MEQSELRAWESRCIQEEPPGCRAGCPIGVDARAFVLAMGRDDLRGARAILDKTMPLAGVTARLCEAPCERFCKRQTIGGPLAIGRLERFCAGATEAVGKILRLPARTKRVSVVGGAPSGLTVAFDLAKKGYPVTVLHGPDGPGGWLRHLPETVLPGAVLAGEVERLRTLGVLFQESADPTAWVTGDIPGDAWYVGGDDPLAAPLARRLGDVDPRTRAFACVGWFGGGLTPLSAPYRFITACAEGREAAVSVDRYLQGASLTASRVEPRHGHTALFTNIDGIAPVERLEPAAGAGYDRSEALREARRCLDCQCLECVRHCVYLQEFKGYPKTYARQVYNNSAIVKGTHLANRLINSCSLCGQCTILCPHDFSMAELCHQARQVMVREGRMPPSAHWFALEEMASVRDASLACHAVGTTRSRYLFFPGCQLVGIRPEQSLALYDLLREMETETGLWFDCCGAPARWSGRAAEAGDQGNRLLRVWEEMGRPQVVTACSSCLQLFREHLAQIPVDSVWNLLAGRCWPPDRSHALSATPLALSDPCTSRHDTVTRGSVRSLLQGIDQVLAPLAMSGALTECCGFGGLMENANPALARRVCEERVAQSPAPFLTYCAMCRDQLARTGKPTYHLLDLLMPKTARDPAETPASPSQRRVNRRQFVDRIRAARGDGPAEEAEPWHRVRLLLFDGASALLEQRRILEDDLRQVLWQAVQQRNGFMHGSDGRQLASATIGPVTFWVEYFVEEGACRVLRAWSHRMRIAGRKG